MLKDLLTTGLPFSTHPLGIGFTTGLLFRVFRVIIWFCVFITNIGMNESRVVERSDKRVMGSSCVAG